MRRDPVVLKQGIWMATAAGLAAFVLTSFMSSVLYGVSARDPMTFALVPLVLLSAALIACSLLAWRASQVDPVVALRAE